MLVRERKELTGEIEQEKRQAEEAVSSLKEDQQRLENQVRESQRLIGDLGRRYLDREEEMRQAEHRLSEANGAIADLENLGLPMERLPELAERLSCQARHQGVDQDQCLSWFLGCLEGAGSLLGLETQIKAKRDLLQRANRELLMVTSKQNAAAAELDGLTQQIAEAKATYRTMTATWKKEMGAVAETIRQEVARKGSGLNALFESLDHEFRSRLVQLGETMAEQGRLEEAVESYAMVRPLVSLLHGDDQLSLSDARVAATAFCLGLLWYLERNCENNASSNSVRRYTKFLLDELVKWRP